MTNNVKKGFTLIETLAATLLLSIAIAGPLTIAQKGLQTALTAKDQSNAFNLAQDGIEGVRFSRDTNCLAAGSPAGGCPVAQWLNGNGNVGTTVNLSPCISTDGTAACYLDTLGVNPTAPTSCPGNSCSAINYDPNANTYTYAQVASSIFTRTISIKTPVCDSTGTVCNSSEALVTVKVSWSDPGSHAITVQEDLFNWQ